MKAATRRVDEIVTADFDDSETTTLRVPTELRNSLKKIAYIQETTLRDLTIEILAKHVRAYEQGIQRNLASLSRRADPASPLRPATRKSSAAPKRRR